MRDERESGVLRGVLVVGHGSRRAEANEDVREAARRIGELGGFPLVEAAFLEIVHPNIAEGFQNLVELGVGNVTVHPYFLSPGRHTRGDLPREVRAAAECFPGVSYKITEPLSAHPLVIAASVERIRDVTDEVTDQVTDWATDQLLDQSGRQSHLDMEGQPEPKSEVQTEDQPKRGSAYESRNQAESHRARPGRWS